MTFEERIDILIAARNAGSTTALIREGWHRNISDEDTDENNTAMNSFRQSILRGVIKVSTVLMASKVFNVPPTYWIETERLHLEAMAEGRATVFYSVQLGVDDYTLVEPRFMEPRT